MSAQTPDRFPGALGEEEVILETQTEDPSSEGAVRYVSGSFRAKDGTGVFNLRSGTGLSEEQHKALRQLIHFVDEGPAESFASGAYREVTGTIFPSAIIWWESSAKLKKIVSQDITWSGAKPTQVVWKIYASDGSTVLATVSDAITYSGVFESSRIRTITVS